MLFNSFEFLIFFPVVVTTFFLLSPKHRIVFLVLASYYFYMCWRIEYALIIVGITLIDYFAGVKMGACANKAQRRKWLILSIAANLSILCFFKYLGFFNESVRGVLHIFGAPYHVPYLSILLPVGVSFHTFQTMAYTIDVYKGDQKPEKDFKTFALYVVFFPQLVAGPIERAHRLISQFHRKQILTYSNVTYGLKRMAWGFFKKVVIADRLALLVNQVYNSPREFAGIPLIVATIFFAFQIYCDFSGYTDIAIGSARVLGIKLSENFQMPYLATSIKDFWKRWHISLTSWFRDYVYISMGGNRVPLWRWGVNIMVVFLVSGLWHGANWTFVIWGAVYGTFFLLSSWTRDVRERWISLIGLDRAPKLRKFIQISLTFSIVCFAWIFFRANSLSDAVYIVTHFFDFSGTNGFLHSLLIPANTEKIFGLSKVEILFAVSLIGFLQIFYWFSSKRPILAILSSKPTWVRFSVYYVLLTSIILFGKFEKSAFIYFQF